MIPIVRVNLRRAAGDRRYLLVATVFPVLFILVTGILAGSPKEPVGLVHPSPRLLQLVAHTGDLKVRLEPDRAQLGDDILRGRVVAGLVGLPSPPGSIGSTSSASPHRRARSRPAPTWWRCSTSCPPKGCTRR